MPDDRPPLMTQFRPSADSTTDSNRTDFWNPTLNIRFRAGHCMAFLYSHMVWMNFDPAVGIILHFSSHTVKLEGRNLAKLYEKLLELRLRQIAVVEQTHDIEDSDEAVVHRATVNQVSNDGEHARKKSGRARGMGPDSGIAAPSA